MRTRPDAGFTLTELMVVVVIVGILSAVAMPLMGRDRIAREGKDFANDLARDLQRARVQAVTDRLPVRAFLYQNRLELRSAVAGATPGAAPRAPTAADPILRTLHAKEGINIVAIQAAGGVVPSAQVLDRITPTELEFNSLGQARVVGGAAFAATNLYLRNDATPPSHPERLFRIEIAGLTGFVRLRSGWQ